MAKQFIHFSFSPLTTEQETAIKALFDGATDWIRYQQGCWIILTGRSAKTWNGLIKPHLAEGDTVLILPLDEAIVEQSDGLMPKSVWTWFAQVRTSSPLSHSLA